MAQEALGSDVNRLTSLLVEICEANRDQRDYTRAEMRRAIREMAACFARLPVVRGAGARRDYGGGPRSDWEATECAKQQRQDIDAGLFDFLRDVLTMRGEGQAGDGVRAALPAVHPPVMAKGVEDTAFYCYNRLAAMNEVGGDPGRDGMSVEEFHAYHAKMQATHPLTMTTLGTHDTKRSDDVRARLAVLSEMPEEFGAALMRGRG